MKPISVVVADDQELVRAGLVSLLDAADDIVVVDQGADGVEAVRVVEQTRPEVALIDIRMPLLDGIEAIARIRGGPVGNSVRLVVLTTFGLDDYVVNAIRAGADAFLLKDTVPDELLRCIRLVAQGDAVMSPSVTRTLLDDYVATPVSRPRRRPPDLTARETDILRGVCEGMSNKQIASRLHLGPATVKTYVSRLLGKFDSRTRVELVIAAYECGTAPRVSHQRQP